MQRLSISAYAVCKSEEIQYADIASIGEVLLVYIQIYRLYQDWQILFPYYLQICRCACANITNIGKILYVIRQIFYTDIRCCQYRKNTVI